MTSIQIYLTVRGGKKAVAFYEKAWDANITMPATKQFWGAYYGRLIDPVGHSWSFAAEPK